MATATQVQAESRRGTLLLHSWRAIWAITRGTFKDTWRQRIILVLLVFGMAVLPASLIFSWLSAGEEIKFVIDTGLGTILLFGLLMGIFMAASMIPLEIEHRTIFTILSKPVRRFEFVLGKFLGIALTLLVNIFLMGVVFLLIYAVKQVMLNAPPFQNFVTLIQALFLLYLQVMLITTIALTVSTVASLWFNIIFSFFVYFVGNMSEVIHHISTHTQVNALRLLMGVFNAIVPHFENFDLRQKLLLGDPVPWGYVAQVVGYTAQYVVVMFLIAYLLFNEREF